MVETALPWRLSALRCLRHSEIESLLLCFVHKDIPLVVVLGGEHVGELSSIARE